jgi:hypothetical protein
MEVVAMVRDGRIHAETIDSFVTARVSGMGGRSRAHLRRESQSVRSRR